MRGPAGSLTLGRMPRKSDQVLERPTHLTAAQLVKELQRKLAAGTLKPDARIVMEGCDCWGTAMSVNASGDEVELQR